MVDSINERLNQYKIPIALSLVGVVLIIGGMFSSGLLAPVNKKSDKSSGSQFPRQSLVSEDSLNKIKVDISGAVPNPGVYTLAKDARIEDLIKLSGGFAASASAEYISKSLNLSQKLSDGQKVYIPFEGEKLGNLGSLGIGGQVAGVAAAKIGINSGSEKELDTLPGVGTVTAQKIIQNRPYQNLDELVGKKVVSKSVFEKIKDLVDLN